MNNYCEKIKPLLSEYVDDALDARCKAELDAHLPQCPPCRDLVQAFRSNKSALRALPLRQTSSGFDAQMARRIAAARKPAAPRSWFAKFVAGFPPMNRVLRPAFATVTGIAAIATVCMVHIGTSPQSAIPSDAALIAHCVEQHRSFVETQPLADMSAQSLAGQLDSDDDTTANTQGTDENL